MAKAIPKWVQERLSKLWKEYDGREMSYEKIEILLKPDEKNTINVFLSELKKAGWVDVKPNEKDLRKKIYTLKEPNKIMAEIIPNGTQRNKS